jgi:phytanoyl-CoA hydroxylase
MAATASALEPEQRRSWDERGYVLVPGFAGPDVCESMLDRVVEITRRAAAREPVDGALVMAEAKQLPSARQPEQQVSKVFRLHRDPTFARFAHDDRVLDIVCDLLGPDVDVFLSQFIFKNPGAYGQPWHQDSYYFPFAPDHQVGVWLAVTEATVANGCLWVLPGSHREPVHEHVPDRRPDSQHGYVEIVDHDMYGAVPVLMDAGDLLVFDSHLMHRSTDNTSGGIRAAMVYHYSPADTVDRTPVDRRVVNDWVPAHRSS